MPPAAANASLEACADRRTEILRESIAASVFPPESEHGFIEFEMRIAKRRAMGFVVKPELQAETERRFVEERIVVDDGRIKTHAVEDRIRARLNARLSSQIAFVRPSMRSRRPSERFGEA